MTIADRIEINPKVTMGKPVIRGGHGLQGKKQIK
jgi:uncharacterized protein (DUF433 family)